MTDPASRNPYQFSVDPVARQEAVVRGPSVRFTVLTSRLLRLEYDPTETFEDRASQVFWCRRQPVPKFRVTRAASHLELETEHLHLRHQVGPRGFTRSTLSIHVKATDTTWRFGGFDPANLGGTLRTLDGLDGPALLPPGLVSRSGWAVVDDSASPVFNGAGWLVPRSSPAAQDLYFFGYGHDYLGGLQDFCKVAGRMPLIPRWALGNWWSRYWEYTQAELIQLMAEFKAHAVPLSACVVDMDWHTTQTGNESPGWTGYTWNRDLFPDPEGFLKQLHEQGLKVALNLHPADGVHPHEAAYPEMARRMGVDPATGRPVPFDIADPKFAAAYFDVLHHPLERQGVDFWWLDWQQGERSELQGLDPLWWLNHLHYYDLGREGLKRPFIFSRWGGLGNHRYPIGFSGDTVVAWRSLAFQPHFTATAANVGYGWWSHDIGGHMRGVEEPELYLRWVQWGVFSPVLRLHSTKNAYHERRPWGYDAEIFRLARDALQLRHALIPYVYAMAWKTFSESRPLVLPMYYLHPEDEAAYRCPHQYYFGSEVIAAPHVSPRDSDTQLSRQSLWLPAGEWFDFFSGERFTGGRWHTRYGGLEDIPVLAKAGAIVPLGPAAEWGGMENPSELWLHLFPGADNRFELFEDDGETQAHVAGDYAITTFVQTWRDHELQFTIRPAAGMATALPPQRAYHLVMRGLRPPDEVRLRLDGQERSPALEYDPLAETLHVAGITATPADEVSVTVRVRSGTLRSARDRRAETCRRMLRAFRLDSAVKQQIDQELARLLDDPAALLPHSHALKDSQLHALRSIIG